MMDDRLLLALIVLLALLVTASAALRWFIVRRELHRHGARLPTGRILWRHYHELRAYKQLRASQARDLSVYYAALILRGFSLALLIAVVLRTLWLHGRPPD